MDDTDVEILRLLIESETFSVSMHGLGRDAARESARRRGLRLVHLDALLGYPLQRECILTHFVARVEAQFDTRLQGISSVPFGCPWFAAMAADRLNKPLLIPSWIVDPHAGFIHGYMKSGSRIVLIDGDPEADDDSRLLYAAELLSSSRLRGSQILGAATIFERTGRVRTEFLRRFPNATYISLINVKEALEVLSRGALLDHVSLLDATDALRAFRKFAGNSPQSSRPPPP